MRLRQMTVEAGVDYDMKLKKDVGSGEVYEGRLKCYRILVAVRRW